METGELKAIYEKSNKTATIECLAEECVELAKAALKLARKIRKEAPTPSTMDQCKKAFIEELADVQLVMSVVEQADWVDKSQIGTICEEKLRRWNYRLDHKEDYDED